MTSRSVRTGKQACIRIKGICKVRTPAGEAEVEPLETNSQGFQALGWSRGFVCTEVKTLQIAAVRAVLSGRSLEQGRKKGALESRGQFLILDILLSAVWPWAWHRSLGVSTFLGQYKNTKITPVTEVFSE